MNLLHLVVKHHVKVGELGVPLIGVDRGKRVLVELDEKFLVCNHEFVKVSLARS